MTSLHLPPEEIEAESFRIIDSEAAGHGFPPEVWPVVRRMIHTSADFEYLQSFRYSPGAVAAGIAALRSGAGIVTDTTMALSGIRKTEAAALGCGIRCFVGDPETARGARAEGITRSIVAMRRGVADGAGIFVIGNAPTALFELLRLVREEGVRPALVVGLPVGFVGAAESKEELLASAPAHGIPFMTARGRKGGSNVAAAVVNALLIQAAEREK